MTAALVESRRAAIKQHLFLLCPNNSGSTFLSRAIATSPNVWSMPHEGQHMLGFAGPSTLQTPWPLIWASSEESLAHFRDNPEYDWGRTKKAWYFHAAAQRENAAIFHTKAPPFLSIAKTLAANFSQSKFLLMVRSPYAALEGIRRLSRPEDAARFDEDILTIGARHLMRCFELQRANISMLRSQAISFTYEQLCADPAAIAARIEQFMPELGMLDLTQKIAVKGLYNEPLRNMNADQISRLSDADIALANKVFAAHHDILDYFGYDLLER